MVNSIMETENDVPQKVSKNEETIPVSTISSDVNQLRGIPTEAIMAQSVVSKANSSKMNIETVGNDEAEENDEVEFDPRPITKFEVSSLFVFYIR